MGIWTIFSRSPAANATRASLEENGPMTASALSSRANLRTATTACLGSPAVSNLTILTFLPLMPPAALISSVAISTATSVVLLIVE